MATHAVVPKAERLPAPMTQMIQSTLPDIRNILPPDLSYDKFRSGIWLELTGLQQLKNCSLDSIRKAIVKAANAGMMPGHDCHFLPFRSKGNYEATFVPSYFGIIRTLERTGKVAKAMAHPVYEGDEFLCDYFAEKFSHIHHAVRRKEPGKVLFYYGAVLMKQGPPHVEISTLEQIDAVRRRSPAHESGPWVTDLDMMSRKTALKRCTKYVQLTPEQQDLLAEDEERERSDISPERHAKNIHDLFGDGNGNYSATPPTPLWMDTLKAHWQELTDPLRSQCEAVVNGTHQVSESEGFALSEEVLAALDFFPKEESSGK